MSNISTPLEVLEESGSNEQVSVKPVSPEASADSPLSFRIITAALPYINNVPHLGHMVGSHLPADIFARYSRQKGHDTIFIGGSDEHGTPSELAAEALGIDIETFTSVLHGVHQQIYDWFGISYDTYGRTSSPRHTEIVHKIFADIEANSHISRETIKMFYDPVAQRFLADRYIEGSCPHCGVDNVSGDQCEACTRLLEPSELVNPRSTLTGATPEQRETEHLFLNLDELAPALRAWVETKEWRPQVKSVAMAWLDQGLRPRGITRDLKHGISVPVPGMEDKVLYVWFEAPIAYISFLAEINDRWDEIWNGDNTEIFHFLGKDNIPFHTVFWPAILLATGQYELPHQVAGMQYLNYEGDKFSKSKQRGVFCEALLASDIEPDLMRAYLAMVIPERADTEFRWEDFQTRLNSFLVNKLSNLVHRLTTFTNKNFSGELTKPGPDQLDEQQQELVSQVQALKAQYTEQMEGLRIRDAFQSIFELADLGNGYLQDAQPWAVKKNDPEKAKQILYMNFHIVRTLACLLHPFLPETANKIWQQLNCPGELTDPTTWDTIDDFDSMPEQHQIGAADMLFKKVTDARIAEIRKQLSQIKDLTEFFN